jgi:hypothetical protein
MSDPGSRELDLPTPRQKLRRAPVDRVPNNVLFTLLIPTVFIFCGTVLAYLMAGFGNPAAPINRLIDRYAFTALLVEAAVVLVIGVLAMTVDRRRTLARSRPDSTDPAPRGPLAVRVARIVILGYGVILLAIAALTVFVVVTQGSDAAMRAVHIGLWVIPVLIAPAVGGFLAYCVMRLIDLNQIRSDQRGVFLSEAERNSRTPPPDPASRPTSST